MSKMISVALLLFLSTSLSAADCDFPLESRVFDAEFSWTNKGLKNGVSLFERGAAPGEYNVTGVYTLGAGQKYRLFRNYLVEWPTFAGNGETGRVKRVKFRRGSSGCVIDFIGEKSSDPSREEIYTARFEVTSDGLRILWSQTEDVLRFSAVSKDEIEVSCGAPLAGS